MAACMFCRIVQISIPISSHVLQKSVLIPKPAVFKNVHRTAWYRSFFQSEETSSPKSKQSENIILSSSELRKPKQPPNVFLLYIARIQDSIKKENPDASRMDIVNEASRRWRELNPEEKSKLALERKEMFDQFKEAKRHYLENMTPEQIKMDEEERVRKESKKLKKTRKSLNMPEKPWTSYKWFLSEKFAERSDEDIRSYFKQSKDQWIKMSPEEKEIYKKKQRESQDKYQRDMMAWEESMIEDGRFDVLRKTTLVKLKQETSRPKRKQNTSKVTKEKKKLID